MFKKPLTAIALAAAVLNWSPSHAAPDKAGWNAWNPSYVTAPTVAPPAVVVPPVAPVRQPAVAAPPATEPAGASVSSEKWYMGHVGAETCVPLNGERLYYGSGSMHTPEDVAAKFRSMGGHLQWVDAGEMAKYARILHATGPGIDTYLVMFNDKDFCQTVMSRWRSNPPSAPPTKPDALG